MSVVWRQRRGFTLIEVLIAVAIASMILVALYGTFALAQRALFDVDRSLVRLQEARTFMDILKREIESAYYSGVDSYSIFKVDDRDYYGHQASSLTMTSYAVPVRGLARINYTVEERDGRLIIMKDMGSAFSYAPGAHRADVLEDVESFTLEMKSQNTVVRVWDSSQTKKLPDEVLITLVVRIKGREGEESPYELFSLKERAQLKIGRYL